MPPGQVRDKTPHFAWAFTMFASKKRCHSDVKTHYYYCLGVFKCNNENCHFLARPLKPTKMSLGAPPNAPKHTCPKHQSTALIWVPCGGNENLFCRLTLQVTENDDNLLSFIATHKGSHGHEKPPAKYPHPSSIKLMKEMIQTNPRAGAAQLRMGVDGRSSLPEVDDAFFNKDRLAYHRRKAMYKGHVTTNKHGITNSMASLFQLNKDIPDTFIVDLDVMTKDAMIITLQSPHMKNVLNEGSGGLQSDTVEGVIDDPNYEGNIDIHFTSAYDEVLLRWVPVLTSIIFGRSKTNFRPHWRVLFQAYADIKTWDDFMNVFPGITMDWSEAEGESFLDELMEF